jgi:hypothetical protein
VSLSLRRVWLRAAAGTITSALLLVACGKTKDLAPSDVVVQFYVTLELTGVRTLPDPRAMPALEPYLTPELYAGLQHARHQRDSAAAASPTEKPPFADGNLFSSLFEGHSTYVVQKTAARGDTVAVPVAFSNTDQTPAVQWTDTLVVVNTAVDGAEPRWRVADLRYGGDWEFGYRGSLLKVLGSP